MEAVDNSTSQARKLIELARKGDENAFTALFRAYSPLIDRSVARYAAEGVPELADRLRAQYAVTAESLHAQEA